MAYSLLFVSSKQSFQQIGDKMKLILVSMLLTLSTFAQADSFTIVQNGNEYLCEQTGPVNPGSSADCADKAYRGPFNREQSMRLCQGARSVAPADCGISAYKGPFTTEESINLCIGARTSNGPVDCANKAYRGPFTKDESIQLCSGNGSVANADCALKAYAGPYSKEESVRLCKANPLLLMRSLDLLHQSSDLKIKIQKIKSLIVD